MKTKLGHMWLLLVVFFIVSCATGLTLKTFEDKQAFVEVSLTTTFKKLNQWRKDGLIDDNSWVQIKKDAKQASEIMDAVNTAATIGNLKEAETQLALANNALSVLRNYLVNKETKP